MLGQCEGSLDDVAAFVEVNVEFWWPAAAAASALAGGDGVAFLRDDRGDVATAELPSDRAGRVRLVGDDRVGASARPATTLAGDVDVGQYFGQHRAVVALAAGDHIRQRPTATVDGTVNLGRQPTS